jgi:hypothetical protein
MLQDFTVIDNPRAFNIWSLGLRGFIQFNEPQHDHKMESKSHTSNLPDSYHVTGFELTWNSDVLRRKFALLTSEIGIVVGISMMYVWKSPRVASVSSQSFDLPAVYRNVRGPV